MKLAEVTYTGPMNNLDYRTGNGTVYRFNPGRPRPVSDMEDAIEFESNSTYDVDWTVHGQLMRKTDGSLEDVREAISEFGYRRKQELAKAVGIKANQSEEELEEELKEEVTELQTIAENQ